VIKKFSLLAVSAGVLLAMGTQAHAGVGGTLTPMMGTATLPDTSVIANIVGGAPPDSTTAHIDANVASSAFSGVVSINIRYSGSSYICSGTLVNAYQVVSAGHCVDTAAAGSPFSLIDISQPYATSGKDIRVVFNSSGTYNAVVTATSVVADPGYLGFGNCPPGTDPGSFCVNHDMAVITMGTAAPATAKTYGVLATPLSGPVPLTMVGYGTAGTGDVGYTVSPSFGVKRSGQNIAEFYEKDDFQNFQGGPNGVYYADFDGSGANQNLFCDSTHAGDWGYLCAPSLANNLESSIGGGDSGGSAFVLVNGQYVLAANNTFSGTYTGQTGGTFGTYFGGINTGSEIAFLQSATAAYGLNVVSVPEPGTYALLLAGLVGVAGIARRRAAAQA
jgi:hypothetical protein